MTRALSRKFHAAKAPENGPQMDYLKLACRITIESFGTNGHAEKHVVELYPASGGRRDQFRAVANGKPWRDCISRSDVYAALRKAR